VWDANEGVLRVDGEANKPELGRLGLRDAVRFLPLRAFDAAPAKVSSHLAGVPAAAAEASAVDVGGGAGGVEAAAVASGACPRTAARSAQKPIIRDDAGRIVGKTIYSPGYLSHCYRVKVGDMIDSIAGQDGDVDCHCSTSSGWPENSGGVAHYNNGPPCGRFANYGSSQGTLVGPAPDAQTPLFGEVLGYTRPAPDAQTPLFGVLRLPSMSSRPVVGVSKSPSSRIQRVRKASPFSGSVEDFGLASCTA